jgi:signal transduction histidine kinase
MRQFEEASESLKQVIYGGTIAFLVLGGFVIFFLVMYMRRKAKNILEKEQLRSEFRQELLRTQLEIQEQTLKTISQEIHDNIGQVLSLAKLNLNTIDIAQKDKLNEKIADSKKLVSKAIQDLRDLSKSMNTDNIEALGLVKAVEYELEMVRKTGFRTELNVEGTTVRLEPQRELIVFRIMQEILNNIIKHAGASFIETRIQFTADKVRISVKDNGKGFDLSLPNDSNSSAPGLGIRNMHNRAKLIGADFNISSSTGNGTEVSLVVPINKTKNL